ncbi:MAG: helix-turn-helix transcriptional regulator [Elusimicrobia bacterium]|nr:helix-turn-helix transcriptional regulator [Elusimicrobiota bacterium]
MSHHPPWALWIRDNASRLRALRLARGISCNQLADEAGVNVSQVFRAEAGRDVQLSTALKIYAGLGYEVELELQETCEEVEDLLAEEAQRRQDRRLAGMLIGKRWC